jgi:hypothetical protein
LVQAFLKKWWVESDFKAPNATQKTKTLSSSKELTSWVSSLEDDNINYFQIIPYLIFMKFSALNAEINIVSSSYNFQIILFLFSL